MNRILLWLMSTLTVVVLLFGYRTSTAGPEATGTSSAAPAVPGVTPSATGSGEPTNAPSTSTGTSTGGSTTVNGSVAQTRWGPVQVALTISNKQITDVSVLQQPSGNPRDTEINAQALPVLIQETKDAQSADIDMVSGATVTSDGYLTSLQAALDEARL